MELREGPVPIHCWRELSGQDFPLLSLSLSGTKQMPAKICFQIVLQTGLPSSQLIPSRDSLVASGAHASPAQPPLTSKPWLHKPPPEVAGSCRGRHERAGKARPGRDQPHGAECAHRWRLASKGADIPENSNTRKWSERPLGGMGFAESDVCLPQPHGG